MSEVVSVLKGFTFAQLRAAYLKRNPKSEFSTGLTVLSGWDLVHKIRTAVKDGHVKVLEAEWLDYRRSVASHSNSYPGPDIVKESIFDDGASIRFDFHDFRLYVTFYDRNAYIDHQHDKRCKWVFQLDEVFAEKWFSGLVRRQLLIDLDDNLQRKKAEEDALRMRQIFMSEYLVQEEKAAAI